MMEPATLRLEDLWACFQGMIPAALSTCASDGTPNITFISQVYYVDSTHIAISHQFFNKTHRNVRENPLACAMMLDPRTLQAYRLALRFDHSEASGPLFDSMSLQLQAIASHAGMTDVFRLRAATCTTYCASSGWMASPASPRRRRRNFPRVFLSRRTSKCCGSAQNA